MVWRALDSLVSLGALALAAYAISEGAEPVLAFILAAIIISGPKAIEYWLVREDYVEYEQLRTKSKSKSRED